MWLRVLRLGLAVAALACLGQASAGADLVPITNQASIDFEVNADGSYTRTLHLERRAGTDTAARTLAVFPWQYSPAHEQVEVVSAYAKTADGKKIAVDPTAIIDQVPPNLRSLTGFSDRREKLIPFQGVLAGGSIVVEIRDHVTRPLLPGVFSLALVYDRTQAWDDARVTLTVPGSLKLQAESVGPEASSVGDGAVVTYAWRYRNTEIQPADPSLLAPVEHLPRLLVTDAADWQQIARAYAALATPQAEVKPLVQQTADAATEGVTGHRAMAEHLYDWVRNNIAYAPVPLADGNVTPHTAEAVLRTHAGDSGDQAVLLSALLAAKGIPSEPVLTALDNLYRLSIPAPFAQLNHVMLYVPEFSAYADTTIGPAPFGTLPFAEYGKPVVHAVTSGEVLRSIPVLAPGAAEATLTTTARLTADDMIVGDSQTKATGPFAIALRTGGQAIAATGADVAGTGQLRSLGEKGTGNFDPLPTGSASGPFTLSGHFAVSVWPHLSAELQLSLPVGLRMLPRPGDLLLGPLESGTLPATDPTPCFAGRQVETLTLDVGAKYRVAQLPADRTITRDAFAYTSHWSLQGQTITVRRELVSRVTEPLCSGKLRMDAADALRDIRRDDAARVGLTKR